MEKGDKIKVKIKSVKTIYEGESKHGGSYYIYEINGKNNITYKWKTQVVIETSRLPYMIMGTVKKISLNEETNEEEVHIRTCRVKYQYM